MPVYCVRTFIWKTEIPRTTLSQTTYNETIAKAKQVRLGRLLGRKRAKRVRKPEGRRREKAV